MGRVNRSMAAVGYTVAAVAVIVAWATWPLCLFILYAIAAQVGLWR
jgi:hypothetical protein